MSTIGYYRYKTKIGTETRTIQFFVNGVLAGTKVLEPVELCLGGKVLKYLDTEGQYRFFSFTPFWGASDNPQQIGTTNKFITNLFTDQTNTQSVGARNERSLNLTAHVSEAQLEILKSIYASPRIYLYIGENNSDLDSDWLEVQITGGDKTVRRRKAKTGSINLTIKLPEHFSIRMT